MLDAIASAENIEVSDEETEAEFAKMAEEYQMSVDEVKKYVSAEDLKGDLAVRKAQEIVTESAVAVAPKAEEK